LLRVPALINIVFSVQFLDLLHHAWLNHHITYEYFSPMVEPQLHCSRSIHVTVYLTHFTLCQGLRHIVTVVFFLHRI